ncbi:hypothetical protein PM082_011435 [Marasmius tenuissimus]|nr:hypothetical protein PM082_011435 [Marasmius tenuissimus]
MPATLTARQIYQRRKPKPLQTIPCPVKGCLRFFSKPNALSNHLIVHRDLDLTSSDEDDDEVVQSDGLDGYGSSNEGNPLDSTLDFKPAQPAPPSPGNDAPVPPVTYTFHEHLNARRCDLQGEFCQDNDPPPPDPIPSPEANDWTPLFNSLEFCAANLLYRKMQASIGHINELTEIITALTNEQDADSLFTNVRDLYSTIDACQNGLVAWEAFSVSYDGLRLPGKVEPWMDKEFMVYFQIETTPYQAYSTSDNLRHYQNFMLGNWAMREADQIISDYPELEGSMLCLVIIGSDKTTVSVATGQNDYYPAYLSNGNITNNARHSHKGGVLLFMFLAVPKTDCSHQDSAEFRRFRRHLFHQLLRHVFDHLRPYMTAPDIVKLADGYYRRVVYSLGPYIGDYPEQVLLACIVQGWCAQCAATHDNLDGPAISRSHKHTVLVQNAMSATKQWDDYGVISEIMVCTLFLIIATTYMH